MQDKVQQEERTIPEMVDDVRAGKMDRRTLLKNLALMGLSAVGAGAIAEVAARQYGFSNCLHASHQEITMGSCISSSITSI